jgi:sortase (surface protein transpeptidase)
MGYNLLSLIAHFELIVISIKKYLNQQKMSLSRRQSKNQEVEEEKEKQNIKMKTREQKKPSKYIFWGHRLLITGLQINLYLDQHMEIQLFATFFQRMIQERSDI